MAEQSIGLSRLAMINMARDADRIATVGLQPSAPLEKQIWNDR